MVQTAQQMLIEDLPSNALEFLLGSRYCETDRMLDLAWNLFKDTPPGWARVQAVCDYVHNHITFGYDHGRPTRTATQALNEGRGVCRDYAHLAIAFCRCLNIPARYCTGYISDIGTPLPHAPGDFGAWIEVYLGGRWHLFDPRNNVPRIGRILMAHGRDAADVALTTSFGPGPCPASASGPTRSPTPDRPRIASGRPPRSAGRQLLPHAGHRPPSRPNLRGARRPDAAGDPRPARGGRRRLGQRPLPGRSRSSCPPS